LDAVVKQLVAGILISMGLGVTAVACTRPVSLRFDFLTELSVQTALPTTSLATVTASDPQVVTTQATTTTAVAPTTVRSLQLAIVPSTTPAHPPGVLIVGDSILEGLNVLSYRFGPNTVYDTEVARSVLQLDAVLAEHETPSDVVVHLGTNGWWPTTGESFAETLTALSERDVVLVNVSVDRPYTDFANTELAALAADHDHVTLVDWNAAATPDILRTDGYHPNLEGYEVLGRLIADGLGLPAAFSLSPPAREQGPIEGSGQFR
jgi:lysophospholipase L1-like esterase